MVEAETAQSRGECLNSGLRCGLGRKGSWRGGWHAVARWWTKVDGLCWQTRRVAVGDADAPTGSPSASGWPAPLSYGSRYVFTSEQRACIG
jgi:hypothetical protein